MMIVIIIIMVMIMSRTCHQRDYVRTINHRKTSNQRHKQHGKKGLMIESDLQKKTFSRNDKWRDA